jgi:hypothetical protein
MNNNTKFTRNTWFMLQINTDGNLKSSSEAIEVLMVVNVVASRYY